MTALLDFDFSYIGTAADEFMLYSFGNMSGGQLPGPLEVGSQLELRNAMLKGFPETLPTDDHSDVEWDVAKAWDEALSRADAAGPRTILNFKDIADIYLFADTLSPFLLDNPGMRARRTAEKLEEIRDETENLIIGYLDIY